MEKLSMVTGEAVGRDDDGSVARPVAGNGPMPGMSATFAIDEQGRARDGKVHRYGSGPGPEDTTKECKAVLKRSFAPLLKSETIRGVR